jgi:Zn finger protein HypA/HybF involved in hydrogenase expression
MSVKNKIYMVCPTCKGNHFELKDHNSVLCTKCKGIDSVVADQEPLLLTPDMVVKEEGDTSTDTGHRTLKGTLGYN